MAALLRPIGLTAGGLAVTLLLAACGGPASRPITAAAPGDTLPFPERDVRALSESILLGKDAESKSLKAQPYGDAMQLLPSAAPQYALYRFNVGGAAVDSVNIALTTQNTTSAFVGIADYDRQNWTFRGPYAKPRTILLDDPAFVSPNGNVWIAIVAPALNFALIQSLSLRFEGSANVAPTPVVTADKFDGVAPLTINFDGSGSTDPDGQVIQYAWDWDNDGAVDEISLGPAASHEFPNPAVPQLVGMRVMDDDLATAWITLQIEVHGAPVATFAALTGYLDPFGVQFDAYGSTVEAGKIRKYEWDFDGDGQYDYESALSVAEYFYADATPVSVWLRVTDDFGSRATVGKMVVPGWRVSTIDSRLGLDDSNTSLLVWNGLPISPHSKGHEFWMGTTPSPDGNGYWENGFAVTDASDNRFYVGLLGDDPFLLVRHYSGGIHYFEIFEDYWIDRGSVANDWSTYYGWSGATINGEPALTYVHNSDPTSLVFKLGSTGYWYDTEEVAVAGSGSYPVLAEISGAPAITYYDGLSGELLYVRALDADGTTWASPLIVDNTMNVAPNTYAELLEISGAPAIVYQTTAGKLRFIRANDPAGTSWPTPRNLESIEYDAEPSLAIVNGLPAISFADNGALCYRQATTADGSAWETAIQLDYGQAVGGGSSLAEVNGVPAITYCDSDSNTVKYIYRLY